jgi:hypothetical protein
MRLEVQHGLHVGGAALGGGFGTQRGVLRRIGLRGAPALHRPAGGR